MARVLFRLKKSFSAVESCLPSFCFWEIFKTFLIVRGFRYWTSCLNPSYLGLYTCSMAVRISPYFGLTLKWTPLKTSAKLYSLNIIIGRYAIFYRLLGFVHFWKCTFLMNTHGRLLGGLSSVGLPAFQKWAGSYTSMLLSEHLYQLDRWGLQVERKNTAFHLYKTLN